MPTDEQPTEILPTWSQMFWFMFAVLAIVVVFFVGNDAPQGEATPAGCDPNYSGACVPVYPPDVNCPQLPDDINSIGSDPHGLDGDGDGVGCES